MLHVKMEEEEEEDDSGIGSRGGGGRAREDMKGGKQRWSFFFLSFLSLIPDVNWVQKVSSV